MNTEFHAHDLIWLAPCSSASLHPSAEALPGWALSLLQMGNPLVVRRGAAPENGVPVSLNGTQRSQRLSSLVRSRNISKSLSPVEVLNLPIRPERAKIPALFALAELRRALVVPYAWGPIGACGYELAATSGNWVTATSDLDIILYAPTPLKVEDARVLLSGFQHPACRCNVQLDTPAGGVSLNEWARGIQRVLVQTGNGPLLSEDPWHEIPKPYLIP